MSGDVLDVLNRHGVGAEGGIFDFQILLDGPEIVLLVLVGSLVHSEPVERPYQKQLLLLPKVLDVKRGIYGVQLRLFLGLEVVIQVVDIPV